MKVAIYPGSFNPLHRGHIDIIRKALVVFDKVIVAKGLNPDKFNHDQFRAEYELHKEKLKLHFDATCVEGVHMTGLLRDFIENRKNGGENVCAIIKGLRNGQDLEYEKDQQYWNEDLGIEIPFFYIISDRNNCHISSSAIRGLEKFGVDI